MLAALIPPSTFLRVLPYLPSFTLPPIRMRTFPASGLSVLHTPPFGRATFAARLVGLLILGASLRDIVGFSPWLTLRFSYVASCLG